MADADSRFHKRIRLARELYGHSGVICSITATTAARRPVFDSHPVAAAAVDVLHRHARQTEVRVHGYCLMPDHVHLILEPSSTCDVVSFVGQFKSLVQREAWRQGIHGRMWQVSFWDHVLRADEQLEAVVTYVLNNPVRRGLATDWRQYPYCGSLTMEL